MNKFPSNIFSSTLKVLRKCVQDVVCSSLGLLTVNKKVSRRLHTSDDVGSHTLVHGSILWGRVLDLELGVLALVSHCVAAITGDLFAILEPITNADGDHEISSN
jgi:hypothetical protein